MSRPRRRPHAVRPAPLEARPPAGLVVERFDDGDEEFAVISWPVAPAAPLVPLSPALADVLASVIEGHSNAQIAARRGTSVRTVANQMATLLRAFGVGSRVELALAASGKRR